MHNNRKESDMAIRLAAIDLDGTLLNQQHKISEENKRAIREAQEKGCLIVPCTGRSYCNIADTIFRDFENIPYYVTANGTVVTQAKEKRVIFCDALPKGAAEQIYQIYKDFPVFVETYIGNRAYMEEKSFALLDQRGIPKYSQQQLTMGNAKCDSIEKAIAENNEYSVSKIHIICESIRDKESIQKELLKIDGIDPIPVMPESIEIVSKGSGKEIGLGFLCDKLGIASAEVMAIGDSNNDVSLLKWAGLSVAMKNASSEVKKAADMITDDNQNNGVAKVLDKFL